MIDGLVDAVATARFLHDERSLRPGDHFECTESELADLRVLGFAQRAPKKPAPAPVPEEKGLYETTVLVAEPGPQDPIPRTKRPYRRRDMAVK